MLYLRKDNVFHLYFTYITLKQKATKSLKFGKWTYGDTWISHVKFSCLAFPMKWNDAAIYLLMKNNSFQLQFNSFN